MEIRETNLLNLNMIFRDGVYYSIGPGRVWQETEKTFHQHRFYYITEGKCTICINGQSYVGIPGRWFFIPAGASYSYHSDTPTFSKYWLHFDLINSNTDLISALDLPHYVDVPLGGRISELFQQLNQCSRSDKLSDNLQLSSLMFALLSEYVRLSGDMLSIEFYGKDGRMLHLMRYITRHLDSELSNAVLAEYIHMDVRNFIRYFKKITGNTPAKYITLLRMSKAQSLLTETDLRISDIMYQVGINDLPLFSKMFKRVYSMSPKAYRETYKKDK